MCLRSAASQVTNAEIFTFPEDNLAVARRADARFEDEFSWTLHDIRGPHQSACIGGIEDQTTHHAIAAAKDDKRALQLATPRATTVIERGTRNWQGSIMFRFLHSRMSNS
jgi:hypothetical protein